MSLQFCHFVLSGFSKKESPYLPLRVYCQNSPSLVRRKLDAFHLRCKHLLNLSLTSHSASDQRWYPTLEIATLFSLCSQEVIAEERMWSEEPCASHIRFLQVAASAPPRITLPFVVATTTTGPLVSLYLCKPKAAFPSGSSRAVSVLPAPCPHAHLLCCFQSCKHCRFKGSHFSVVHGTSGSTIDLLV